MKEKNIEDIEELQSLVDNQVPSYLSIIGNYVGELNEMYLTHPTGSQSLLPHTIEANGVWHCSYLSVPRIGPNTNPNVNSPLLFQVSTFAEHVGNIWVFQEARSIKGVMKFYVGEKFNYLAAKEIRNFNPQTMASKYLKLVCGTPGNLTSLTPVLY
ncbi:MULTISPECIES: hypothetical protein [Photorhabdus]|uniref:hypothetical protein n=1 Tax=Photorhabdus TaxID=29487 RepID=UPI000DCF53D3|nr:MULTISPECIES: hypothetical protein [Photorhabdus]MCT8343280.1 hypothetical protein [Photorhabdus kleinii]RAW98028.1 hypothetical protein CKY05_12710 [Photorhabdus sp. S10-54]RAW98136.1 hypothetical protein CKY03_12235 [Photorhabdus sp. S9-53]RAX02348.1 hypothetical protein CKY04_12795 [Photorhabdus sp. S8-52]